MIIEIVNIIGRSVGKGDLNDWNCFYGLHADTNHIMFDHLLVIAITICCKIYCHMSFCLICLNGFSVFLRGTPSLLKNRCIHPL